MIQRTRFLVVAVSCWTASISSSFAGARFDIRPTGVTVIPGNPPTAVVTPGQVLAANVFLVDTGNPQGSILFRGIFLDFTDTSAPIVEANGWAGNDGVFLNDPNTPQDETVDNPSAFDWICAFDCFPDGTLPNTAWVYPLPTANPLFQITVPDNGETQLGVIEIEVPSQIPAIIDLMNADDANPNFGAFAAFGFNGPGDPLTQWRAHTGELTGGQLLLVPEPTALFLLVTCASIAQLRNHQSRERKRPVA